MSLVSRFAQGWKDTFTGNAKKGSDAQPYHDWGLLIIGSSMMIGVVGMIIASLTMKAGSGWLDGLANLGLSLLISLAAGFTGGVLGFLFGIPRSLQRPDGDSNGSRLYGNNTNLEQISDWLTKIIVGVGLTQIKEIQNQFELLNSSLAAGFVVSNSSRFPLAYSGSLIIYYTIGGFLSVYLYSKIYLLKQLSLNEKNVQEILDGQKEIKQEQRQIKEQLEEKIESTAALQREIKLNQLRSEVDKFNRQKNRTLGDESISPYTTKIAEAAPGPVKIIDDCQKGRWGGKVLAGSFTLKADFLSEKKANGTFTVKLLAQCDDRSKCPDNTDVLFFLHDSYSPDSVVHRTFLSGTAFVQIESWQAFTFGVYIVDANVRLELDLNQFDDSPKDYKYDMELKSIDKVDKQISQLEFGG